MENLPRGRAVRKRRRRARRLRPNRPERRGAPLVTGVRRVDTDCGRRRVAKAGQRKMMTKSPPGTARHRFDRLRELRRLRHATDHDPASSRGGTRGRAAPARNPGARREEGGPGGGRPRIAFAEQENRIFDIPRPAPRATESTDSVNCGESDTRPTMIPGSPAATDKGRAATRPSIPERGGRKVRLAAEGGEPSSRAQRIGLSLSPARATRHRIHWLREGVDSNTRPTMIPCPPAAAARGSAAAARQTRSAGAEDEPGGGRPRTALAGQMK